MDSDLAYGAFMVLLTVLVIWIVLTSQRMISSDPEDHQANTCNSNLSGRSGKMIIDEIGPD